MNINNIDNEFNSHLIEEKNKGKLQASLKYGGNQYKFVRKPNAPGWDAEQKLPADLWGRLVATNIRGGGII